VPQAHGEAYAAVCFQIIWNVLREPMQRALEALAREGQTEGKATFPPFAQQIFERGIREDKLDGIREGELKGKRDALLRLLTRAGLAPTEDERARILACTASATLDQWIENVLGAKTAKDVLT
jgi:hypothetical protein